MIMRQVNYAKTHPRRRVVALDSFDLSSASAADGLPVGPPQHRRLREKMFPSLTHIM